MEENNSVAVSKRTSLKLSSQPEHPESQTFQSYSSNSSPHSGVDAYSHGKKAGNRQKPFKEAAQYVLAEGAADFSIRLWCRHGCHEGDDCPSSARAAVPAQPWSRDPACLS